MSLVFPDDETQEEQAGRQDVMVLEVMDFEKAKEILADLTNKAKIIVAKAEALQVVDEPSAQIATQMGIQVSSLFKGIEEKRDGLVRPHNEWVKKVNNFAKLFTDPLKRAKEALSRKVGAYTAKVELDRRKAEEAARKEREAMQAQVNAEAEAAGVEAPVVPSTGIIHPVGGATVHRTEDGVSYGRKHWEITIVDESLVPREYCSPDLRKIRAAVEGGGVRVVPGAKIEQVTKASFRG